MSTKKTPRFRLGDRVRERSRLGDDCVTPGSPNFKQVCQIMAARRYGHVVGFQVKRGRNGRALNYVQVQWDHLASPSLHATGRIERVLDH
jgi:hypothetical protein